MMPRWILGSPCTYKTLYQTMQQWQICAPVAQVIAGYSLDPLSLCPPFVRTPNPALLQAAKNIIAAIDHKRIRIHGDYDADGVSATAILVRGLQRLGADVHGFIPHRLKEGYGIHMSRVPEHIDACDLLITVDCGVTNLAEIQAFMASGKELIVTDHHAPGEDFPDCLVVHPHLTSNYDHDYHNLTGAGVAYHLLWAIHEELQLPPPLDLSALACIGTIADVAPLLGENRSLVQQGLAELSSSQLSGIRAIRGNAEVTARHVAFSIAPLINAAGRMGKADLALELFLTDDEDHANVLVDELKRLSAERRSIQDQMFQEAQALVCPDDPVLVLTHPEWHAGVMGIVASKLLDQYHKPVYIMAQGKGSVRSTPGISAVQGLRENASLLKKFGGHMGAAGFSMNEAHFEEFKQGIHRYVSRFPTPQPRIEINSILPFDLLDTIDDQLKQFQPFGEGIKEPLFLIRSRLEKIKWVGSDKKTLQYHIGQYCGFKFNQSFSVNQDNLYDLCCALQINNWKGKESKELRTEHLRNTASLLIDGPETKNWIPRYDVHAAITMDAIFYAQPEGRAYLLEKNSKTRFISEDQTEFLGTLVLLAVPPEDIMRTWIQYAHEQGQHIIAAWGPRTRHQLQHTALSAEITPTAALDFRRWQLGQFYELLDDASWNKAIQAFFDL